MQETLEAENKKLTTDKNSAGCFVLFFNLEN